MKSLVIKGSAILLGVSLLAGGITSTAAAAGDTAQTVVMREAAKLEITSAPRGQQLASEAAKRFSQELNAAVDPKSLKVYDLSGKQDGSQVLILPASVTDFTVTTKQLPGGKTSYSVAMPVSGKSSLTASDVSAQSGWSDQVRDCMARVDRWDSHMSSCYRLAKHSSTVRNRYGQVRSVWALHQWGAAASDYWWRDLTSAKVKSMPKRNNQEWADWNPRVSRSGACESVTLPLSMDSAIGTISLPTPITACERWVPTVGTPGYMETRWSGVVAGGDREVGYGIEVMTATWDYPDYWVQMDWTTG